jgi:putative Holliday junction resolvase
LPRILALDIGQRKVGVAVSDSLGITAQPLMILARKPHQTFLTCLEGIIEKFDVGLVVLGLPRRTTGKLGPEAQRIMAMAYELRTKLSLNVTTWEEWLTTAEAIRVLRSDGLSNKKIQQYVDKTAATLILEGYLQHQSLKATDQP